jgi:hypothetical protein
VTIRAEWLACGVEEGGEVRFSQPEVALYDWVAQGDRPGYPDIIEASDSVYITETNKTHARRHEVAPALLSLLYAQDTLSATATAGRVAVFNSSAVNKTISAPPLPDFTAGYYPVDGYGATVGLWLTNHHLARSGEVLIDTRYNASGAGLVIAVISDDQATNALNISIADSDGDVAWVVTDPSCTMLLNSIGQPHYAAAVLDAGAHLLSVIVDGVLCDGGVTATQGWVWVPAGMGNTTGRTTFRLAPQYHGNLLGGDFYNRWIYTSEAVGNFRAGPPQT